MAKPATTAAKPVGKKTTGQPAMKKTAANTVAKTAAGTKDKPVRDQIAATRDTIKAEATANTEIMLIVDVDLLQLKELHEHGSVQIMKDRRTDLYDVVMRKKPKAKPKEELVSDGAM